MSPGERMAPAIAPTLAPHFCAQPAQPLSLDHSHRLRRLPRWPFLEIAARFHPLAGPPCRPIGRQGPGFDSPRRDGGRNLFVPPPLQRQALRVNAAPLVSVSSPPPRARCTLHRPPAPAYPPLEHDRPLLSTTSLLPPRVWQAVVLVGRTNFGSAQGAPPPARPQSRSRSPCTRPPRRLRWRPAHASCWGRPRTRCARPRRAHAPPLACARRPSFAHGAAARRSRRTTPAAPTTPLLPHAGTPRTTLTPPTSPITHTPLSSHLHPYNPIPPHPSAPIVTSPPSTPAQLPPRSYCGFRVVL